MTLGEKLQNLRNNQSMSQEKFAELMGVSRQSVSKWELDQSLPELDKLVEISNYYDISLDKLIKYESLDKVSDQAEENKDIIRGKQAFNVDKAMTILRLIALVIAATGIRFFATNNISTGIILEIVACVIIALSLLSTRKH